MTPAVSAQSDGNCTLTLRDSSGAAQAAGDEGTRTPSDSQDFVPDEESGDLDEGEDKVGNDGGYLGAGPDEPRTIAAPGLFSGDLSSAISAVFNGQSPGPSSPESNNHAEQEKPAGQSQAGEPRNETSNSSLVLVGNGRSVTAKKMGSIIDSYGIVGRFNYFELGVSCPSCLRGPASLPPPPRPFHWHLSHADDCVTLP
jgi:hypothetical protein